MKIMGVVLILVVIVLVGCPKETWEEFSSSRGGFSVILPSIPQKEKYTGGTPFGEVTVHMFSVEYGGIVYLVGYSDYPDSVVETRSAEEILNSARDGSLAALEGKLLSEESITCEEYPGKMVKIEPKDGTLLYQSRIYLVKGRVYQTAVISSVEKAGIDEVKNFMDSFRLNRG
jgi:hypothetical protein